MSYNPYFESIRVLQDANPDLGSGDIRLLLEDVNSPVTRQFNTDILQAVIDKGHIDFGDIPRSAGDITRYSGYTTMMTTLETINKLAVDQKNATVLGYVNTIKDAVGFLRELSPVYQKGFRTKTDYVALEYNSFVYFCVQATTALIYSFVEIIKFPDKDGMNVVLRNTKIRADEFYFEQLANYVTAQKSLGGKYAKTLDALCENGTNKFTGVELVGLSAIMIGVAAIVPITREIIYQIYNIRTKVSEFLEVQARFLEANKACVENNANLTADKKKDILKKQENLAQNLRKLSDKVKIKAAKAVFDSKRDINDDNKKLSLNNIKDEVSTSDFQIM